MTEDELYAIVADTLQDYINSGVSAKHIAENCSLSQNTVKKFAERKVKFPRMHTVFQILIYFGYSFYVSGGNRKIRNFKNKEKLPLHMN